ncbi:type II toxin-antitoxin system VapC family toxin [Dongia sp.]|uniref:type II toxin-antitoxin system VapC family toxin n=1 Tax=Dongia sp. TaxID=1977262 RepID=UPI0035B2C5D0
MAYLLDTNILSHLVRNPQGIVRDRIAAIGADQVATSIIVAAELRFGAAKLGSPRLSAQLDAILHAIDILPFETPMDVVYGSLRAELEQSGMPIGANDLLIAAQALALDYVLVTDNHREFARVTRLRLENWLR